MSNEQLRDKGRIMHIEPITDGKHKGAWQFMWTDSDEKTLSAGNLFCIIYDLALRGIELTPNALNVAYEYIKEYKRT